MKSGVMRVGATRHALGASDAVGTMKRILYSVLVVFLAAALSAGAALPAKKRHAASSAAQASRSKSAAHGVHSKTTARSGSRVVRGRATTSRRGRAGRTAAARRPRFTERFSASSFADNLTAGDVTDGEDPVVRAAAIEALGSMNGTALAIDPSSGRILAMVNQKLALSPGAEPCSTIKLSVALAALEEGIIHRDTAREPGRALCADADGGDCAFKQLVL